MQDRVPPQNIEAEQSVLGAMLIEKISITVPIHDLDEPTINELSVLIKNNPGHSLLYFKVVDGEHNISLNLFSQNIRLNVTRELVDFLQENENIDFKING